MATGKALDGKPYAGNPHVRFDEGEVASAATPRRGSLLYIMMIGAAAVAPCAALAVDAEWTGAANADLCVGSNWSGGEVPTGGTATISVASAATLTCSGQFSPSALVFASGSAAVTISGVGAISGLTAMTNFATSVSHVFNVPVSGGDVAFDKPNYYNFKKGITVAAPTFGSSGGRLNGQWHITADTWDAAKLEYPYNGLVADGTIYNIHNADCFSGTTIQAGAISNGSSAARFLWFHRGGTIRTDKLEWAYENESKNEMTHCLYGKCNANATIRANEIVHNASVKSHARFGLYCSDSSSAKTLAIVVGSGGIHFGDNRRKASSCNPWYSINSSASVTIGSSADWTFASNPFRTDRLNLYVYKGCVATFDTADYDNRSVPHTITQMGMISGDATGSVVIKGCGEFKFAAALNSNFKGGLSVTDTATCSVVPGATPGYGTVTVGSGATFKVPQSGTVSPYASTVLADGACLSFNFSEAADSPTLDVANGFTRNGTVNVTVTANDGNFRPGSYTLVSGANLAAEDLAHFTLTNWKLTSDWRGSLAVEDGSLVLVVRPKPGLVMAIF